jgi:rhodanese-related sulfurtransferase
MHRVTGLVVAAILALDLAAPAWAEEEEAPMQVAGAVTFSAEQIIALINSTPDLVIIDSRKPEDFRSGAIEGAVLLTDTEMTHVALAKAVPSKATPVLFYCNGVKCGRAADAVFKAVVGARDTEGSLVEIRRWGRASWSWGLNRRRFPLSGRRSVWRRGRGSPTRCRNVPRL